MWANGAYTTEMAPRPDNHNILHTGVRSVKCGWIDAMQLYIMSCFVRRKT